mmetsp:Transcript_22114/g.30771  ORF Transcript_22114/g.30771 Transcript_22114/m.30771 type:complete len:810 (+) Transcript_22114:87-2516(+)
MVTTNGMHQNIYPAVNGMDAAVQQQQQDVCGKCGYAGCDVRVSSCGCTLHARCTPVAPNNQLTNCPRCHRPSVALLLLPMSFNEIDEACKAAAALSASGKRGKKRKSATIARLNPEVSAVDENGSGGGNDTSDLRTGRWTTEETAFCDKLIAKFEVGALPIADGIKLNDFLSNMLKSKQSRLTKKMKNAKLSSRTFAPKAGYIMDVADAREFSELEDAFIRSISCSMERAEIRFHMQKEWREQFSSFCVAVGQQMNADDWLSSVEEMDRRTSQARDAARMARRKVMMGYALKRDMNPGNGVFIDKSGGNVSSGAGSPPPVGGTEDFLSSFVSKPGGNTSVATKPRPPFSPFLGKVMAYVQRNRVPFEHVDAWVPSFVPPNSENNGNPSPTCRLCFGGYTSSESEISFEGHGQHALTSDKQFDLLAFGEYSQKFSFDVGCGLPGRVYQTGVSSWEQNVQNAPGNHFERCGGAVQWGIKTVLGVPIPSPNVGRIVVVFYSRYDRPKDQALVTRMCDDLTKMLPAPKWKLVVDVGTGMSQDETPEPTGTTSPQADNRVTEIISLMDEHMPTDSKSQAAPYLPGFTSLKLLLAKSSKNQVENDMLKSLLDSYSSYISTGRHENDIALMLARDYMFLSQQQSLQQKQQPLLPRSDAPAVNDANSTPFMVPQPAQAAHAPATQQVPIQPMQMQQQQIQPNQMQYGQMQSGQVQSGQMQPNNQLQPNQLQPNQLQPGQIQSGQMQQPNQMQCSQLQSGQVQSTQVQSGQMHSGQMQSSQMPQQNVMASSYQTFQGGARTTPMQDHLPSQVAQGGLS